MLPLSLPWKLNRSTSATSSTQSLGSHPSNLVSWRASWQGWITCDLLFSWLDVKFSVRADTDNPRDNLFIFKFTMQEDFESVLCSGLWSFDNRIAVFEVLKLGDQISESKLDSVEFCVHVLTCSLVGLPTLWARL